jgi:hypothetical protein
MADIISPARSATQHFLKPGAHEPPRPAETAGRKLTPAGEVINGRDRQVQQVGDLARRHHLITSKTYTTRDNGVGGWELGGRSKHARQDAPNPADIARATWDVFEDVRGHLRTSTDILILSPAKPVHRRIPRDETKVANENLRAALERAGLAADDVAQIVQVDVRTVRRWLSGGTPYPRQRAKVARALDSAEHDLWPEIATAPSPPSSPRSAESSDLLAGYPAASDPGAPDLQALMRDATSRIELLGDTLIGTLGSPRVPELLTSKASDGCAVRILIYDTHEHLGPLLDAAGIEIRLLEMPADYTIHRFDDQLLLTLHAVGPDPHRGPLIHLRRAAPGGMFDRLADYYDHLWEQTPEPLRPDPDHRAEDDEDEDGDPQTDSRLPVGERPAARHSDRAAPPPRRWPRRPDGPRDHG